MYQQIPMIILTMTMAGVLANIREFRSCDEVCGRYLSSNKPYFTFEIWNVTCQDKMCLTWTRWYHRASVPKTPDMSVLQVDYDLRVLYFDEFEVRDQLPGVLLWIGMQWIDQNIMMCDCSGINRTEILMDLEEEVWIPDVTIYNRDFIKRRQVYTDQNIGAMLIRKQTQYPTGVQIYFYTQFSTVAICERGSFDYFPWFSRICMFRLGIYRARDTNVVMKMNQFTQEDLYGTIHKVQVKRLCREEALCNVTTGLALPEKQEYCRPLDGFKLMFTYDGYRMSEYFQYLTRFPVLLSIFNLLMPGRPSESLGVDRYEPAPEAIICMIVVFVHNQKSTNSYLEKGVFWDHSEKTYALVLYIFVTLSLLTLTRRFDIFPEFCVFIYAYCLPSFPYVVYERDEFTVVEELGEPIEVDERLVKDMIEKEKMPQRRDNLIFMDRVAEGREICRWIQRYISHLKWTHKLVAFVFLIYFTLYDHTIYIRKYEETFIDGPPGEVKIANCTCDCEDKTSPLLPLSL